MERLITFMLALATCGGAVIASERMDSLSYALGHQYTLATMAGQNDLMQSQTDFEEYIRGLEENSRHMPEMNDSSYMVSWCLGAMEAVFMTDGIHHRKPEDLPPFPCIIAGLRKVGDGEISLPADTVAAMAIISRYDRQDMPPADPDERCRFFTAYGVMKAYQPGLQGYIEGLLPGTGCVEDRQALATGMADVLEAYTQVPETAYAIGRSAAFSVRIGAMDGDSPDMDSFVAGAKAALGLGDRIIARDEVEKILELRYMQKYAAADWSGPDFDLSEWMEYIGRLGIEPHTPYSVDWKVTVGTVADEHAVAAHTFFGVLGELGIEGDRIAGALMATPHDVDGSVYAAVSSAIRCGHSLPEGYKWFCGHNEDGRTTVGIMQTGPMFKADVRRASVDPDPMSGMVNVSWSFDAGDALNWAEFTGANTGRHAAMEIDGVFISAPMVNCQITGGRCAVSGLSPEEVTRLFRNAEKVDSPVHTETIEVTSPF